MVVANAIKPFSCIWIALRRILPPARLQTHQAGRASSTLLDPSLSAAMGQFHCPVLEATSGAGCIREWALFKRFDCHNCEDAV